MSFKFPPSDFMNHVSSNIVDLCNKGRVDLATYVHLRMNSYENKYIQPYLTNEAFIWKLKQHLKQVRQKHDQEISTTYEEYLAHDDIFELLRRFENEN